MYPAWLIVTTMSSSLIRSSSEISPSSGTISVRRASPYFFFSSPTSLRMMARIFLGFARMPLSSSISLMTSRYSASI
jgi:hypothetical protein